MNSNNKKRVVSTLFLYVIILLLGCDFQSPEQWENPAWYTDLTLPLINKEFSFGGLLSDTIFYSDTLNAALPADTVSEVIHLNYPVIMPPVKIPDEIFDIDMSIVKVTKPDFGDMGDPIEIPPIPDYTLEIPILTDIDTDGSNCFLKSIAQSVPIPEISEDIPTDTFPVGNDFLEIRKIFVNHMDWWLDVENDLPIPIKIEFSIKNGDASLFTVEGVENIEPETSVSYTESNSPDSLDLTKKLTFTVKTSLVADTPTTCSILGEEGWDITAEASLKVTFGYDFGLIKRVLLFTNGIDESKRSQNTILGGDEDLLIFRAKMAESTELYPNKVNLNILNNFFLPSNLTLTFENFFDSVGIDNNNEILWDNLELSIDLEPSTADADTIKATIDYSGFTLAATKPVPGVSAMDGDPITSINLAISVKIDSGEVMMLLPEDGKITQTGFDPEIKIENMSLEYIEAITHELQFTAPPSPPIGGIPDGFTDIEFVDLKLGMDLSNEIGIPMSMNLNIEGSRTGFNSTEIDIKNLEIGVPYGTPHNCYDFEPIGDTARTVILLTKDSLHTAYYCNNDISDSIVTPLGEGSDLVGLINIVPEQMSISGEVVLNGEGRVARGTSIWGTIILDTPLSFIFKKQMTIIPGAPWPLAPMDDPEISEKINSSLIEGEFFVDITNRSSLGGSFSLLISDSTIFPLFLDSLITGTWEENRQHQMTEWGYNFLTNPETATDQPWAWDSLGIEIDSISYTAIDPSDDDSKALEVHFFHQDSLQFFVGRMFELVFPPADTIDYDWGYATPAFPGLYTSSVKLDTTILSWLISDQPRNSTAMITFDGSKEHDDGHYTPVTSQTINAIAVQAYLTLKLDTDGFNRVKP